MTPLSTILFYGLAVFGALFILFIIAGLIAAAVMGDPPHATDYKAKYNSAYEELHMYRLKCRDQSIEIERLKLLVDKFNLLTNRKPHDS